jgi:hypothetical protein
MTGDGDARGTDPGGDGDPALTAIAGWSVVVVRGRSMLPTLRDGDRLLARTRPADATRLARPGRLAVLRLPGGRPVSVKRLVRREPDGWWVERDNPREGVDSWHVGAVPDGDVLGVVVLRVWPRPARL